MYWCSFRATDDSFIGVVICRGKSPGAAANYAITKGIVESEKASIMMIPAVKEYQLETFVNRLLGEEEARKLINLLDTSTVEW